MYQFLKKIKNCNVNRRKIQFVKEGRRKADKLFRRITPKKKKRQTKDGLLKFK